MSITFEPVPLTDRRLFEARLSEATVALHHEGHPSSPAPVGSAVALATGRRLVEAGDLAIELPVEQEQVIGFVEGKGHSTPVRSPFGGKLMGLLAHAGERVREGQPVAWLRCAH